MNRTSFDGHQVQSQGDIRWNPIADTGSLDIDPQHFIVFIDRAAASLLNCDRQKVIGYNVWDLLCNSLPAYHQQAVNAAIKKKERHVVRTRLKDSDVPVFMTVVPWGNGFVNITIARIS